MIQWSLPLSPCRSSTRSLRQCRLWRWRRQWGSHTHSGSTLPSSMRTMDSCPRYNTSEVFHFILIKSHTRLYYCCSCYRPEWSLRRPPRSSTDRWMIWPLCGVSMQRWNWGMSKWSHDSHMIPWSPLVVYALSRLLSYRHYDKALQLMRRATAMPARRAAYHDKSEPVQNRLFRSLKVWSMYADLEESLGTFEVC